MRGVRPAQPAAHRESRIQAISRYTIGAAAANFALLAYLTRLYTDSPWWLDLLVIAFGTLSLVTAVVWVVSRWFLTPRGIRTFIVFADLGTGLVLTSIEPLADAVIGCALFGVIGLMAVFFLPRRWLVAHTLFATVVTAAYAGAAIAYGAGVVYVLVRMDIVLFAVVGPILTVELAWRTMRERAVLASTDPLTGVRNLRGMWSAMVPMVARSARTGESVAVAVADIDGFKSVNDIHGHDVGDEVIAHVAGELTGHVGDLGVVARSGGEEFTIALIHPSVDLLCDRVRAIPTRLSGGRDAPTVTLSVGVTFVSHDTGTTPRDVARAAHRQADKVMYEQKRSGGNGVRVRR
ncbi:MAG: GGDEF domain-containing protein [Williamsia herbipolensis]|uniref:Diguanylate cyclase (GGDEF) domain-containing protein n=1 Tax=Williamsia serinedens TaxID=391736 RepID=A0ABT1GZS2_9NOCA|nr:GGDEF domain-containing protein [Williamsia serinedens]MBE7160303.1 GGDEF domain-containing protein [Williamsia herbipolensis]MCP2159865.1 diguanylate cyclase (GGDEF) domain-containing protein [Williamsia serinedens]